MLFLLLHSYLIPSPPLYVPQLLPLYQGVTVVPLSPIARRPPVASHHSPSLASLAAGAVDRARLALASVLTGTPTDTTHKNQGQSQSKATGSQHKRDYQSPMANMSSPTVPTPTVPSPVVIAGVAVTTVAEKVTVTMPTMPSLTSSSTYTLSSVPSPASLSTSVENSNKEEEDDTDLPLSTDPSPSPDVALGLAHVLDHIKDHTNLTSSHEGSLKQAHRLSLFRPTAAVRARWPLGQTKQNHNTASATASSNNNNNNNNNTSEDDNDDEEGSEAAATAEGSGLATMGEEQKQQRRLSMFAPSMALRSKVLRYLH